MSEWYDSAPVEACLTFMRSTWRLLQDLLAACRAAVHASPRRVAPGEHFGSPSSEALELWLGWSWACSLPIFMDFLRDLGF